VYYLSNNMNFCVFVQLIVTVVIYNEQKKAVVTSGVMFLFFLILSVFGILSLYSYVSRAAGVCLCLVFHFHYGMFL